ncbi:GNAT family N-acetyltransferase [Macrococcus animalis]|uniref:GNAT family N-acetyltransferase n=1 Tax=Macrococcus animalis TaxID=3395467 RepID=UPI0039BE9B18
MIKRINNINEPIINLLLLADPSIEMINQYVSKNLIYVLKIDNEIVGVIVLKRINETTIEVMNIAVSGEQQGKGYGKQLLKFSEVTAKELGCNKILIATANSSLNQLALYQKCGFRMVDIEKDFFINEYKEVIMENGIRAMDKVILAKDI